MSRHVFGHLRIVTIQLFNALKKVNNIISQPVIEEEISEISSIHIAYRLANIFSSILPAYRVFLSLKKLENCLNVVKSTFY